MSRNALIRGPLTTDGLRPSWEQEAAAFGIDAERDERDRAYAAIEGRERGLLTSNPWHLAWSSAEGAITGPVALRLDVGDPIDVFDTESVALVWDAEVLHSRMSVREGNSYVVEVEEVQGEALQVWITDSQAPVGVHVRPLAHKDAMRAELVAEGREEREQNVFARVGAKAAETYRSVGIAGVVVAGIVVWALLRGKV